MSATTLTVLESGKPLTYGRISQMFGYHRTTVHYGIKRCEAQLAAMTDHRQLAYERSRREWRIANSVHYPNMLAPGDIT